MKTVTPEGQELLKLAINELQNDSKYAGMTEANITELAERIAALDNSDSVEPQHIAEAVQYGGNINVWIGQEIQSFIVNEVNGIIPPIKIEQHYKKQIAIIKRIKEVFQIDPVPIVLREISFINSGKYGKKFTTWSKNLLKKQVNYQLV